MEIWERAKVEGKGKSVGRKGKNINGSRHNRETAIPFITPQGGFGKKKKKHIPSALYFLIQPLNFPRCWEPNQPEGQTNR
jgi:hypothetical protein